LSTVHLQGRTEADSPFNLSNWRGKVVLIYAWNSRCAVCISHMPELRANRNGWAGQAFDIVSINTDPEATDITQWHRLQQQTIAPAQRWPSLWTGSSGFSSNLPLAGQLPAVWVLDKTGAVKFHVRGRVPTEVWNQIADLL
jgi:thiol-disulfide isomerase/thioredoxin